jgi:NAD(P)-dependent dehydrogenase (short-subunit alcohol dehydrogenase family)
VASGAGRVAVSYLSARVAASVTGPGPSSPAEVPLNVTEVVSESPLTGRVALVTGGATALGRACGLALARAGCLVALTSDHDDPEGAAEADAAADLCERESGRAIAVAASIGVPEEIERVWVEVTAALGAPTVFVHAAGAATNAGRALAETTPAEWREVQRANVDAAFYCARAVLPAMRAQGFGRIILLAGGPGDHVAATPGAGAVVAAHAALVSLVRTLAAEEQGSGVTVNAVGPGSVPPEEVARVVAFLASPASVHISGAHVAVGAGGGA